MVRCSTNRRGQQDGSHSIQQLRDQRLGAARLVCVDVEIVDVWASAGAAAVIASAVVGTRSRSRHVRQPGGRVDVDLGRAFIFDEVASVPRRKSRPHIYDREIELALLYEDPDSRAEHYVIRYPAGLRSRPHRHTAAHTVAVVQGRLTVNDTSIGPGGYCHFPAGETMVHEPMGEEPCLFVTIFDGPFDVEALDDGTGES